MYLLRGTGVANVFLRNGFDRVVDEDGASVAIHDLEGLIATLAVEVAVRSSPLTAGEFRFLRKRLNLSQSGLAERFGKEAQAVAKWEKGVGAVPRAEAEALRVFVLAALAPDSVPQRVAAWLRSVHKEPPRPYVLGRLSNQWVADRTPAVDTGGYASRGKVAAHGWFERINSDRGVGQVAVHALPGVEPSALVAERVLSGSDAVGAVASARVH